jgi:ubiquinol-cytochrome c reductase iron-sulfur subunit
MSQGESEQAKGQAKGRRNFLYTATTAFGAVTVASAVLPIINYMNPDESVKGLAFTEVDIAGVSPGQQLVVKWRGKPVFIRHRTQTDIAEARSVVLSDLVDSLARNKNIEDKIDAEDKNRTLDESGKWLVVLGVCTHLGCIPIGNQAGDYNGWFCPCHGSHYDTAGRIRKGPAPENLEIPPAAFISDTVIRLG